MENNSSVPILIPMEQDEFWKQIRCIIREEIGKQPNKDISKSLFTTPGLTYKPLYKIQEVCGYLQVTRPTIYEWIRQGKLKPYKIRSRVYFLYNDIQELLKA